MSTPSHTRPLPTRAVIAVALALCFFLAGAAEGGARFAAGSAWRASTAGADSGSGRDVGLLRLNSPLPVPHAWLLLVAHDGLPPPPPPRPPAPAPPPSPAGLSLWSDGDSVSYFMTTNLFSLMSDLGATPVRAADYKISARLTAATGDSAVLHVSFSDWFTYLASEMAIYDPDLVVFMVGANDAGFVEPETFGEAAGRMMDLLRRDGRLVAWVGLPSFVREDLATNAPALNAAARAAAASRSWVVFVDTSGISPDADDGVHFGPTRARLLAQAVVAALFPGLVEG